METAQHSTRSDGKASIFGLKERAQLLDNVREAVVVIQMDYTIVYWNKAAETLYGWKASEVLGLRDHKFLYASQEDCETLCAALKDRLEWEGEIQQKTRDDRKILVSKRATVIFNDQGHPDYIYSINRDITDRKRREIQALRIQRLESIGTLAGGIAHDLNNMLTPILLSIDLLKNLVNDPAGMKVLELVQSSAQRGSDLVGQLLTYSRGEEGAAIELQPTSFLKQVVKMARETFPRDIDISFVDNPALWKIRADPVQLEQLLLNLCVNARDAMPAGGYLTITAENTTKADKSFILLQLTDTGKGICSENLERIFDPFFTTKAVGKGTGFGLATVQSIVQAHGGSISVQSELGKGSVFSVLLPAIVEKPAPVAPSNAYIYGKGETILVVDDEPAVREVARRTLEVFGYQTLVAADGAEAVEIYRTRKEEIALVFTDIMMPILDGVDASKAMFALNPQVKIIATSGLSSRSELPEPLASRLKNFLPKPYATTTMLQLVRAALDGSGLG